MEHMKNAYVSSILMVLVMHYVNGKIQFLKIDFNSDDKAMILT